MMKTCLIYGQNGLDLDVAFNVRSFYQGLGYKAYFSDKLYSADLLVILRGVNEALDLSQYEYSQVHVYDYGGWNFDGLIQSLNKTITTIFTTCENTQLHLIKDLVFPEKQIVVAFPPVDIKRWVLPLQSIKYNLVHVGNYKPIDEDGVKTKFNRIISVFGIDVWGLNWAGQVAKGKYHGKLGLFDVSKVYAQSERAVGLMYPFQRDKTFSGRFWHAPLNGCPVISEPGLYTKTIPGILETDYTDLNFKEVLNIQYDRAELQQAAINFWEEQNMKLERYLSSTPRLDGKISFSLLTKMRLIAYNKLKSYYQKFGLFKLLH